jgi:hypothetical protein
VLTQKAEGAAVKELDTLLVYQSHLILVVEVGIEVEQPQVLWIC